MKKQTRWKADGCEGVFYCRGKNDIIYYDNGKDRISLKLPYSRENREKARYMVVETELSVIKGENRMLVQEAVSDYMNMKKQTGTAIATLRIFKRVCKTYLQTNYYLDDTLKLQKHITNIMLTRDVSKNTILNEHKTLSAFFNHFIKSGIIRKNPVKKIARPKVFKPDTTIYSQEEVQKIFTYFKEKDIKFYWYLRFVYFTAFRRTEALSIKKTDYRDKYNIKDEIQVLSKSKEKYEYFPISEKLKEIIINSEEAHNDKNKLFNYPNNYNTNRKINGTLLKKLNIDISNEKPLHCLRKTRISFWLFEKGLHPHEVSKLARHSIKQMEWYYKSAKYSKIEQIDID